MNILILEDELKIRKLLESKFHHIYPDARIDSVKFYEDAKKCVIDNVYDIISLDIHLPDGNGLDLAKFIRENTLNKHTYLLMITGENTLEIAFAAYDQTRCYKFLGKPFTESDLLDILVDLKATIEHKPVNEYFTYKGRQIMIKLPFNEIVCFEVRQRSCTIKTINDNFTIPRLTIKDIIASVSNNFIQCHRSLIVNKIHIQSVYVENRVWQAKLSTGEHIPVGKKFLENIKDQL